MCLISNRPVCVLQVTGIMLPLLKFYFQEEVRQAAVQCIPDLLRSAYLAAQKGMQGADADYVRRMVDFIWGPLVEAIGKVLPPCMPCLGLGSGLHPLKPCRLSCLTRLGPLKALTAFHLPLLPLGYANDRERRLPKAAGVRSAKKKTLWEVMEDGIKQCLQEPDTEVMSDMLEALEEIIEMLEPALLPMEKLAAICEKLQGILADSAKRRAERLKRLEGEDFDEDEALAIEVPAQSHSSPWILHRTCSLEEHIELLEGEAFGEDGDVTLTTQMPTKSAAHRRALAGLTCILTPS